MGNPIMNAAAASLGRTVSNLDAAKWAWDNLRSEVKGASWRVYVSRHLADISAEAERNACRELYRSLRKSSPPIRRKRTESKRKKAISDDDYNAILNELKRGDVGDERTNKLCRIWLTAGINTGLRPIEWVDATIITIENQEFLRCKNAKIITWDLCKRDLAKQGRIRAAYRVIPIEHLTDTAKTCVKALAVTATQAAESNKFKYLYDKIRQRIGKANDSLWPDAKKRLTLYSARHSFRDRFRASLLEDGKTTSQADLLLSVVMGHGSKSTQYAYGEDSENGGVERERSIAVDGLLNQKNVLIAWALSQLE